MVFVQDINHIRYFFAKRKTSFEVSTFGGSLFSGGSLLSGNTCDFLSLLSEVRYFRGVVTFGTLRTFEFVNEVLWCYHSNETSSAALSHGTICLVRSFNV